MIPQSKQGRRLDERSQRFHDPSEVNDSNCGCKPARSSHNPSEAGGSMSTPENFTIQARWTARVVVGNTRDDPTIPQSKRGRADG
mmetsp:Transcript_8924/g.19003  ORF Transcript_8924/g.19003 Transcript_8924/m.19003 type:complete len:85 (+) Transcript_8924:1253-1507(+)